MKKILVKKCIWLGFALICFLAGLFMCLETAKNPDKVIAAYFWFGFFCIFPIIGVFFRIVGSGGKSGRSAGANHYTASSTDTTITVQNHPFLGWVIGILLGGVVGLLIGPIFLPIRMLIAIKDIIILSIKLSKEKKNKEPIVENI